MNLMNWNKCENEFIRKVEIDHNRINSIIEIAEQRFKVTKLIKHDANNSSFIIEGYYEVIKELLVAYLLKNGFRSKNHQCLITFFYNKNPNLEFEADLISQMSFFRNRLDYYGEKIPESFYEKNKEDIENIVKLILDLLKK